MMMRSLVFTFFLFSAVVVFSQNIVVKQKPKPYSRVSTGYAFISGMGQNDQMVMKSNGKSTYDLVPYSYGKGLNFTYAVGCMFTPHIGFDAGLSYFIGGKSKEKNFYKVDSLSPSYTMDQLIEIKSNLFRINPAIILSAGSKFLRPYARIGFITGWGKAFSYSNEAVKYSNGQKSAGQFNWEFTGIRTWGYTSSLGIRFGSDLTTFFVEVEQINMSGKAKVGKSTLSNINGVDVLPYLSRSEKEVVFVDKWTVGSNQSASEPAKAPNYKRNFSSVGFNLGFLIYLR